jgi:hypothetical protein
MKARYLNPFTDFGLKKLFGEDAREIAELAHLTDEERAAYETSLKHYRDMLNVVDTARMEGEAMGEVKGEKKALLRIVSNMLSQNFSYEQIQTLTGLSVEVLNAQLEEQTDSEASEPNPQGPPMSN